MLELTIDAEHAEEQLRRLGWTDGLPVVLPTPDRVAAMLAHAQVDAHDAVGGVPDRGLVVDAGTVAANAVLAGCEPAAFPLLMAAVGAALDPAFNATGAMTSTGGAALCLVVSGPMAGTIGMNARHNAFGGGDRANATLGRALRLTVSNVLGIKSTGIDGSSFGQPGKLSLCFAEDPPPAPWQPLRIALGYDEQDTTVTVLAADSPRQIGNHLNPRPEAVLATVTSALAAPWAFPTGKGGVQVIVVLGPEHASAVIGGGWSRAEVQQHVLERTRVTPADLATAGVLLEQGHHSMVPDADGLLHTIAAAEDVLLVTAGGAGAGWSMVISGWAPRQHSSSVTRRVRPPGEGLPECGPDGCVVLWD